MKNIYEMLNGIRIDSSDVLETTDDEKEKYKRWVKAKISKRKWRKWKNLTLTAAIAFGVLFTSLTALSFTTLAEEIPLLNSIFNLFSKERPYESFPEKAETLNLVATDNDVTITLNQAVFDGQMFFITFTIDSEKDLGERPWLEGKIDVNSGKKYLRSYHREIKKIGEHQYAGLLAGHILQSRKENDPIELSWNITSIFPEFEEENVVRKVDGRWNFAFSLSPMDTVTQMVTPPSRKNVVFYDLIRKEGVLIEISSITYTPVSFLINYTEFVAKDKWDEWDFIITRLIVRDDLGNEYTGDYWGGFGGSNNVYSRVKKFQLFNKLDPEATKLFITPVVRFANADGVREDGGLYRDFDSTAPEEIIELEEIVVPIEK